VARTCDWEARACSGVDRVRLLFLAVLERRRGDEAVFDFFYLDALHGLIFGMTCGVSKLFSLIGPRAHEVSRPGVNKSASDF
jgi:hypothetical protein